MYENLYYEFTDSGREKRIGRIVGTFNRPEYNTKLYHLETVGKQLFMNIPEYHIDFNHPIDRNYYE